MVLDDLINSLPRFETLSVIRYYRAVVDCFAGMTILPPFERRRSKEPYGKYASTKETGGIKIETREHSGAKTRAHSPKAIGSPHQYSDTV